MDITTIIISTFLSFILNGVLILIFRSIIQAAHDREMAEVRVENQKDLARLNALLERMTQFQVAKFSDLHQRRAEVIAELYRVLAIAESRLQHAHIPTPYIGNSELSGWDRAMAKIKPTTEAVDTLVDFYRQNKLFLTRAQVSMMDPIIDIVKNLRTGVMMREMQRESPPKEEDVREFAEETTKNMLDQALKKYREVYPALKENLEGDFRLILGFDIYIDQ